MDWFFNLFKRKHAKNNSNTQAKPSVQTQTASPSKPKPTPQTQSPSNPQPKVTVTIDMSAPNDQRTKKQNSNTDYSNVCFLSLFDKARPLSDDDTFGSFVAYDLHIYDPIKKRNNLLKNGFLRLTTPTETLETYKVSELKEILKKNELPVSGKKADLISRVVLSVDPEKLTLPPMCCISNKGQELIDNNKDLIKLRGNPYSVTYDEYIATKNDYPSHMSYNDLIWRVFDRRERFSGGNYNVRSLNAYHRAKFLKHENKLEYALEFYLYYLFFELNDPSRVIPESIKQYFKEEEIKTRQLDPYLLENIFQLKEYFDKELIDRCYDLIDVPQVLIKRRDFERLLNDIFASNPIDVRNYLPKGLR